MGRKLKRAGGRHERAPRRHKGDLDSLYRAAAAKMFNGKFAEVEHILAHIARKHPLERARVGVYRARMRMMGNDFSPDVWRLYAPAWKQWAHPLTFTQPEWDGSPIPGQRLLIAGPGYGYGDWIMLARLLPKAKVQSQARVLIMPPKGLGPLLSELCDG